MRRLAIGIGLGVVVAFFARWRGGFSTAVDEVQERLPEPPLRGERTESGAPETAGEDADAAVAGHPDDPTLVARVKTEVLRDDRFKGNVNVAAEYGRVILHGELEQPELIDELVAAVRRVDGVRDVESRLHTPAVEVELPKRPPA